MVSRLSRLGAFVTVAATRDKAEYLTRLGAQEVRVFDLEDPNTWRPATEDVTHIFSSTQDKYIAEHMEFASFCGKDLSSQLRHVVRISCMGADDLTAAYDPEIHVSREGASIPLMLQHYWWSEQCFIKAGLGDRLTSIRGNFYMNHLLKNELDSIRERKTFSSPLGDTKNSFVACNDMGEAAATCLLEGPEIHGNKFYDITGSQSQSMTEIAADLTTVLASPLAKETDAAKSVAGETIVYEPQDPDEFERDFGPTRAEFFEYLRNGFYSRCSPDFYNLTGKRPMTYVEYLTTKGAAGDTGLAELFSSQGAIFTKGKDLFKDIGGVEKIQRGLKHCALL